MLIQAGDAIEGDKVSGASRKPLLCRGFAKHNGVRCHRFEASFNVSAQVDVAPGDGPIFEPNAMSDPGAELKCDKAICHSMDRRPGARVTTGSSTHQINAWHFSERTSIRIHSPHVELVNAAAKRLGVGNIPRLGE